jgi:NADH-quinone oxidoreductase subunit B
MLVVSLLALACCSVEAADALVGLPSLWPESQQFSQDDEVLHVLVVAGTVTTGGARLVQQALVALPEPRAVVAFGVCTISGGPYWDSYSVVPGIGELVPVDVFVPGCPPHPQDLRVALDQLADRAWPTGAHPANGLQW